MQTLQELSRKMKSADQLHGVVRTMKTLAAVGIRQYEEALRSLEDYSRAVELGLRAVLLEGGRAAGRETVDASVVLVCGSDLGMAGQFNEAVIDFAEASLKERGAPLERVHFWVAGFKTAAHVEERFGSYDQFFTLPSSAKTLVNTVQDVLLRFEKRRRERGESRFLVVHNSPLPGASYTQRRQTLLPPDARWLKEAGSRRWPRRGLPFHRLEWTELFSSLIGEYLFVSLFRAFAASMAAEHAARLSSMQRAESNIEELREGLVSRYHSLRQSTVTEELLDVVSGFEALSASG